MALKVKDGLFLGDAETSYDPDFLELNKVSNLINLSGREVQNVWAAHGLVYLSFLWEDRPNFRIFSDNEADWDGSRLYPPPLGEIVDFIDGSLKHGISVLLFSTKGTGRCVLAMCAYLMCKYQWSYEKAYNLLSSKNSDVSLNRGFIQQLQALDKYLLTQRGGLQNEDAVVHEIGGPMLDGMRITLSPDDLARWRDWSTSYLPAPGTGTDEEEADAEDERMFINSFLNSKHNSFAAQMILPFKNNKRGLKFHARLTHVQDGSIANAPVTGRMSHGLRLRSCLKGKAGAKRPSTVVEARQSEAKSAGDSSRCPQGNSDDLYGFVGIDGGAGGNNSSRPSSAPQQRGQRGGGGPAVPSYIGLSVEERLQQMMVGLEDSKTNSPKNERADVADGKPAPARVLSMQWEGEEDRSSNISRNFGQRAGSAQQQQQAAPALSLYDLANMPLHPTTNQSQQQPQSQSLSGRRPGSGGTNNSAGFPASRYTAQAPAPQRYRPSSAQPKSSAAPDASAGRRPGGDRRHPRGGRRRRPARGPRPPAPSMASRCCGCREEGGRGRRLDRRARGGQEEGGALVKLNVFRLASVCLCTWRV